MKNTGIDSLNALDLFSNNDNIILHIPHSSTYIPNYNGYIVDRDAIDAELELITDWATDDIFMVDNITNLKFNLSRIYCDVERLRTGKPMDGFGRGIYYTKSIKGDVIRNVIDAVEKDVLMIYDEHHNKFNSLVKTKLNHHDEVIIIDCHSFNDIPLAFEDNTKTRPDICIGINEFHTPIELQNEIKKFFTELGYSVEIDYPYSNTIVPSDYLNTNPNVKSIMIEVNKRLYMDDNGVISYKVKRLNNVMTNLYSLL